MELHFPPDLEKKLQDLAAQTGRDPGELVQDAVVDYFGDLDGVRDLLGSRYDDIKSGRVKLIDGEEAFSRLKDRGDRLKSSNPQNLR